MASTIKLNYNHKVINYDHKRDATIQSVNLTSSFTIVIYLYNRPRVKKSCLLKDYSSRSKVRKIVGYCYSGVCAINLLPGCARYLMGESLKVAWPESLTLS